jgi:hypothetical protein
MRESTNVRNYLYEKTGTESAGGKGTHYVTNHKLILEILKEISDSDDVLEVAGPTIYPSNYNRKATPMGNARNHKL